MIDDDLLTRALLDQQIADAEHIAQARTLQSQDVALTLYDALIHHDILPEPPLVALVAGMLGLPHVDLDAMDLDPGITGMLSSSMATRAQVLPISLRRDGEGTSLQLAMLDPFDLDVMDEVAVHTGINIQPMLAGPKALQRALIKAYPYVAPVEPAAPLGQEDSWAMFFEGNAELGVAPVQPPAPLSPQLGAEESAVISQDMRDRPTSMEFDLLDLEEDPQPPMLRTMYLEEEDVVELSSPVKPPRPPAVPPAPTQNYAEIGNFFVDHDMRKSGPAAPVQHAAQDDADFFDSFFSEEALRPPADAPAAQEDQEDSPFILTDEVAAAGDRFHNELERDEGGIDWSLLAGSANREASQREIEEAEQAPVPSRWTHDASRSSIQLNPSDDSEPMILLDTPAEEEGDSHTAVASPAHFARPEPAPNKGKLGQLRARLGQRDADADAEDAPSHTAIAGSLSGRSATEDHDEARSPSEPPRKLSLGKLGSSLSNSAQAAAPASLSAGLLKKAPVAAPEPEPEPTPAAPALGRLQLKKIPAKPLAIEEHYAPRVEPATRAFNPDAATREMTDADLFSFVPSTSDKPAEEPLAAVEPLRLGAHTPAEEAMLEEHTRARVVVPTPIISGRSSTDTPDRPMERVVASERQLSDPPHDPLRETSANSALTRASLLRMSRQTSELDSPKSPAFPDDLTERQLLHAALSLLIEHGVLSLDDLIKRARKL